MTQPTDLLGRWRLARRLRDRHSGLAGTVAGTLTLDAEDGEILWREHGVLRIGESSYDVHRTYRLRWLSSEQGSRIEATEDGWWVHFEDGREFHPWRPGEAVAHPCRADLYEGLIRVDSSAAWRVLWQVHGPTKDQTILTRLSR